MPSVLMPDGVEVELPDNPTPDQLNRLRAIKQKFETPPDFTNVANRLEPLPDQVIKRDPYSMPRESVGGLMPAGAMAIGGALGGPVGAAVGYGAGQSLLELSNTINRRLTGQASVFDVGREETTSESILRGLHKNLEDIRDGALMEAGGQVLGKIPGWAKEAKLSFLKSLPGSARALHQQAAQQIEDIPSKYLLKGAPLKEGMDFAQLANQEQKNVAAAFQKASSAGYKINTDNIIPDINKVLESRKEAIFKRPEIATKITGIIENLKASPGGIDPVRFQQVLRDVALERDAYLGDYVPGVGRQNPKPGFDDWDAIYKTFREFLNDSAKDIPLGKEGTEGILVPNPSSKYLKDAINQAKRRHVAIDLHEAIVKGIEKNPAGYDPETVRFNSQKILRAIEKNDLLNKTIDKEDLRRIKDAIIKFQNIPKLPPPAGAKYGSGTYWLSRTTGAAIGGGTIGLALGGSWEDLKKGASIGVGVAVLGSALMSKLMMTDRGTAYLLKTLNKSGGKITPELATQWGRWLSSEGALINALNSKQGIVYQNGKEAR